MKQEITIDFENIENPDALQQLLFEGLNFPGFYGMNWDAFWDAITGLIEMPKILTLKNHKTLQNKLPKEYKILIECLEDMNKEYPDIQCKIIYA